MKIEIQMFKIVGKYRQLRNGNFYTNPLFKYKLTRKKILEHSKTHGFIPVHEDFTVFTADSGNNHQIDNLLDDFPENTLREYDNNVVKNKKKLEMLISMASSLYKIINN